MSNSNNIPIGEDCIELGLPINPAYVSAARLTASSIANRMGFNIEEIEDIKAAVSEACTYLIKRNLHSNSKMFQIQFRLIDNTLEINLTSEKPSESENIYDDDTLGIMMIEALMDKIFVSDNNSLQTKISMAKNLH